MEFMSDSRCAGQKKPASSPDLITILFNRYKERLEASQLYLSRFRSILQSTNKFTFFY